MSGWKRREYGIDEAFSYHMIVPRGEIAITPAWFCNGGKAYFVRLNGDPLFEDSFKRLADAKRWALRAYARPATPDPTYYLGYMQNRGAP